MCNDSMYPSTLHHYFDSIATVHQFKVAHRRPLPLVDTTQGVSAKTRQPLADVSVPGGSCVSGNEAIRYAGFITFT